MRPEMQAPADSASERRLETSHNLPLWRRILPFVVGGALVAFVVGRLDLAAFLRALGHTNYVGFFAFAMAFSTLLIVADVYATTYVYRRTIAPVKFKELFVIRAAAYLPSMVNHHIGQAWLTYFLSKAYGAPLTRAAGATLIVYVTTFGALFAFLLVGLPLNHGQLPWLLPTVAVVGAGGVAYGGMLLVRPSVLTSRTLFEPIFETGVKGHLAAMLVRVPHVFFQFLGAWVPFFFFGVKIPFADALALMPILMFVVTLPVSPQGLGTRDALSVALFSRYAPGVGTERASIVAATTLSWLCILTIIQISLSPLFMRRAYRLLGRTDAAN
jgi:hypothetical protein